ncbi:MAG: hypothetical protein K1X64_18470 [Myxococcaceae bacterium]|nr:hypothetical protein [Myxococcaceae bacterium]
MNLYRTFISLLAVCALASGCFTAKAVNPRPSLNVPPQSAKMGLVLGKGVPDMQKVGALTITEIRKSLWNGYVNGFGDAAIADRYGATPGDYVVQIDKVEIEANRLLNIAYLSARYKASLKNPNGDVLRTSNRNVRPRNVGSNGTGQLIDLIEVIYEQMAEDFFANGNPVGPGNSHTQENMQQM